VDALRIDLSALDASSTDLARIANEFDDTDTMVDMVTDAIGQAPQTGRLRHAVEDFAGTWRIHRQEVKEDVRYLAQIASAVSEYMTSADGQLAQSLSAPTDGAAATEVP